MSVKDIKKLWKIAQVQGWTKKQCGGNHIKWLSPCGEHMLTVSASPSDVNASKQIARQLRKLGYQV